jgi:hypothetical protein
LDTVIVIWLKETKPFVSSKEIWTVSVVFMGDVVRFLRFGPVKCWSSQNLLYIWPQLTNRFFKTAKFPQNEVQDGKILEKNEGGLHLGV